MFCQKKKSRLQQMQQSAGETLHSAQETLHEVLENAPERLEDWKQSAGDALHGASEALHGVVSALGAKADVLKSKAEALRDQTEATGASALDAARRMKNERAERARAAVQQRRDEFVTERAPETAMESGGEKWLWLLLGIGIGAALGVLFAPATGRRSRALLKDKLTRGAGAAEDLGESVLGRAHDLSNRAQGAAHDFIAAHSSSADDVGDDVTIADRVRTELGRLEKEFALERLNVDSCDGVVTLRGPVGDEGTAEILVAAAQQVAGVREVKNELAVEGDGEAFVG